MDILKIASPPKKLIHSSRTISPPPFSTAYDRDDDGPALLDEKPSGRRSERHHDTDNRERALSKKPRHRHSPVQLAALNELFDRNEHPSLEERTELAERLGMETKTVNAWFQNKRASTKKRNKSASDQPDPDKLNTHSSTLPSIANLLNTTQPPQQSHPRSHPPSARKSRQKDLHLNDNILADPLPIRPNTQSIPHEPALEGSFFVGPSDFLGQERFILSHHRGRRPELGAVPHLHNSDPDSLLPDADNRFVSENDTLPSRRGRNDVTRMRTSTEQARELRHFYSINDHPTREQRQQLADKIGMRIQSVTNWFQNQRSQAKKHREESSSVPEFSVRQPTGGSDPLSASHTPHPPLPPRSHHPSLAIPEHDTRSPLPKPLSAGVDDHREASTPHSRMSLPPSLSSRMPSPRMRRGALPYARDPRDLHLDEGGRSTENTGADDALLRPRRSRPDPHQLVALKELFRRTSTPSIEERNVLALEIGMDIGKVTNWFRNIRQTRKHRKRSRVSAASTHLHEHDASSGSSVYDDDDAMDLVYEDVMDQEMDDRSEEEFQEAVTPFTDVSSSPPPNKQSRSHLPVDDGAGPMDVSLVDPSTLQEFRKAVGIPPAGGPSDYDLGMDTSTYSSARYDDALLLLNFHQHVVH